MTHIPLDTQEINDLKKNKVHIKIEKAKGDSLWLTFLTSIVPLVLLLLLFFWVLNQAQGGGKVMNFGKTRASLYNEEKKRVTFDDVAGADEEKAEWMEIVDFLKHRASLLHSGPAFRKGYCWSDRRVQEKPCWRERWPERRQCPFSASAVLISLKCLSASGHPGCVTCLNRRRKTHPCIIFIDEIDAVGRQRGAGLGGGHDEREQTLNQLLVEMDGFGANEASS